MENSKYKFLLTDDERETFQRNHTAYEDKMFDEDGKLICNIKVVFADGAENAERNRKNLIETAKRIMLVQACENAAL